MKEKTAENLFSLFLLGDSTAILHRLPPPQFSGDLFAVLVRILLSGVSAGPFVVVFSESMDKELWQALQNLDLGSERAPLKMSAEARRSRDIDNRLSLIVKGLNPQHQKPAGLKGALPKAWRLDGRVTSRINDDGTVQFFFKAEHHLMSVLENGPWHHNFWMVAVDRWTNRTLSNFLSQISFWVKILHIPEDFRTDPVIRETAGVLGHIDETKIIEATADAEGEVWAHVTMNISDRLILVRSVEFEPATAPVMVRFVFAKLKKFCFRCGSLLHDELACNHQSTVLQLNVEATRQAIEPMQGINQGDDEPMQEGSSSSTHVAGPIPLVVRETGEASETLTIRTRAANLLTAGNDESMQEGEENPI